MNATMTADEIRTIRNAAAEAGDTATVDLCSQALGIGKRTRINGVWHTAETARQALAAR